MTRAGTPFEPRNLNRRFETGCAKAGVRLITVHDMRHTCATLLAALDVHPRVAMRILRHAQIDVDRPGDLGGSDPWEDAESCQHSGSTLDPRLPR
jgi:hypothetical protein